MLELTAIFLAAAVLAVPLFKRFGLGTVLGYLAGGALIGPSGLAYVSEVEETLHFAEFGVVLLLFVIGLELEPMRLWRLRGAVFGTGGLQVLLSTIAISGVAMAFGLTWQASLVVGLALAMSSTAFATQILTEKHEMATAHGQAAFGILLFQDLAAIPALAFVPLLGTGAVEGEEGSGRPVWLSALIVVGVIAGLIIAGRLFLRPLLRIVATVRSHELSIASALLVVIATALLMEAVGLSTTLGAFMAGVLLADSEYRHELESNIEPFKGLFLGLFFMAVGMSANLGVVIEHPILTIGLSLALVAVKAVILFGLGRWRGEAKGSALSLSVAISAGGEFAFVIFAAAGPAGVLTTAQMEVLIVIVTLSMAWTPLLFIARDRLLKRRSDGSARPFDEIQGDGSRVIIAGFGRFGQIVGRLLRLRRVSFTALDSNPEHVDFLRKFGNRIHYGDASRLELLRAAKAQDAQVFVLAIDDFEASMRTLHVVQEHFPHLRIVARARNRQHAYALYGAGIETVIRENFLGSVHAAERTLEELGFERADSKRSAKQFAQYDEDMVKAMHVHRDDEKKLIASAKQYGAELERIFNQDATESS
ncbi:MAG: cation:proton antiporter [Deltaproteobacteria bacterium]|nr:cation:proton antiporter [Deltaproteobacteria bacterium]